MKRTIDNDSEIGADKVARMSFVAQNGTPVNSVFTLPAQTSQFASTFLSEVFSNKYFTDTNTCFANTTDQTKRAFFDLSGQAPGVATFFTTQNQGNQIIKFSDFVTDTVVCRSTTDDLTNKTITLANATASYVAAQLNYHEFYSYVAVVSGPIPNNNMNIYIERTGRKVLMYLSGIKVNGNSTSATISITGFPSRFAPVEFGPGVAEISHIGWGYSGGAGTKILLQVPSAGNAMTMYIDGGSNFASSAGATGFDAMSVCWISAA